MLKPNLLCHFLKRKYAISWTLGILAFLLCSGVSYGQDSTANVSINKRKAVFKRLNRELSLSEDQRIQVKALLKRRSEEIAIAKTLENQAKADRMKLINKRSRNRLKQILSDEQFDQYVTLRAQLREFRRKEYEGRDDISIDDETDF